MFAIFKCVLETFWHFDHASWRKEIQTEIISLMHFGKSTFGQNLKLIIFVALKESMDVISIMYSLFLMDQIRKLLVLYCPNNNNLLRLRDGSHSQEHWTFSRFWGNESFLPFVFNLWGPYHRYMGLHMFIALKHVLATFISCYCPT